MNSWYLLTSNRQTVLTTALLLEKCEYATATLKTQQPQPEASAAKKTSKTSSASSSSSMSTDSSSPVPGQQSLEDSLNQEITAFVKSLDDEGKALLSDDPDLDQLVMKAIQVLKIHLMELDKVSDLANDFCHRYITCLRSKMSSENLLRGTGFPCSLDDEDDEDDVSRESSSDDNSLPPPVTLPARSSSSNSKIGKDITIITSTMTLTNPLSQITAYQMTPNAVHHGVDQPSLHQDGHLNLLLPHRLPSSLDVSRDSGNEGDLSDDEGEVRTGNKSRKKNSLKSSSSRESSMSQKRGILPKQATHVMRSWLFQHIVHPYPTEEEKKVIAGQTNLTMLQVNNWFINARRRILQPMLDTANHSGSPAVNSLGSLQSNSNTGTSKSENNKQSKKLKSNDSHATSSSSPHHRLWGQSISQSTNNASSSAFLRRSSSSQD